jgi:cell division protein FtsB
MAESFSFTLIEKIELMQRIRALETENAALRKEIERLTIQNELLREDMKAFAESKARPHVLPMDRRGVLNSE